MKPFKQYVMEAWKDYRSGWRGQTGKYDDKFFNHHGLEGLRADENSKAVGYRSKLSPKPDLKSSASDVISHDDNLIHRGMSHGEYQNILKSGKIQSKGAYNIGDSQKGLTYFTTDPAAAGSYAHGFAPKKFKPTPNKPAYIVSIRRPDASQIAPRVNGTASHEIGVKGHISSKDIVAVHRGKVVQQSHLGTTVHWEKIK